MTVTDLSSQSFWALSPAERELTFAELRAKDPISWHKQPEGTLMPAEEGSGGYWAVVRYDDVRTVSRDPGRFRSGQGVLFEDFPEEILEASQSFLATDDPRHKVLRGLVAEGFKPRQVKQIEDGIRADARQIVADLEPDSEGDFVDLVAKRLPMMTVMRMLGAPEDDWERVIGYIDRAIAWSDPEIRGDREPIEVMAEAMMEMTQTALDVAAARREEPDEDLMGALVDAEVDGERLTDAEIAAFFVLLSVAGNDTTRHTTSHAMRALSVHPDQRQLLLADLTGGIDDAVEEFVRWASPIMTFRRTATEDTELAGQAIAAGDKVVMFYPSANRDESVFEDPNRFEITRSPNRHVGFGGGGPHFCMGASLARTSLKAIFSELFTAYPRLEVSEPTHVAGNFVSAVSAMPMRTGPYHS